jgi:iron complex transport system ATP-binding protein
MTVLEYCLLARHPFLDGLQLAAKEDVEIVRWALNETQASAFERRWMNELSGGERQRVILARALAQTPRLLLLDEPTLNLDVAFQMGLLELVDRVSQECGLAVLMVTHELNLASEFAQQVLLLQDGRSLAFGPAAEVMTEDRLRSLFNAEMTIDRNPISGAARITLLRRQKKK